MVGLACISKCVVCEKGRRTEMAASDDEEEGGRGGRKRRSRNLACTSINLHLLVRALPRPRRSLDQGAPSCCPRALHQRGPHSCLEHLKFKMICPPGPISSWMTWKQWTSHNHQLLKISFESFLRIPLDFQMGISQPERSERREGRSQKVRRASS